MANRKINELSVRTPSLTDLMIVGDPSTGYSFKATLAALNTLIDSSTSIGDLNGVVITSPTNGQALVYNGTNWVNQSISVPVTSVFGRTGAVVATEGDYSLDLLSDVTLTTPSSNQVLQYNGTAWVNATLTDNGITSLNGLTALSQTFATGTSGTDFAISSTTSTHTFNLPTASAVNRGALSSADWSTFNAKQDAITLTTTGNSGSATLVGATLNIPTYTLAGLGGVSGSGTTNYLSKWTSSSALGNSLVQDDGTSTGINSTPSASGMVSINRNALTESIILTSSDATNRIRFQNTGNTQIGIIQFSNTGFGIGCGGSYLSAIEVGRTTNHVGIFGSPDASFRLSVNGKFKAVGTIVAPSSSFDHNITGRLGIGTLFTGAGSDGMVVINVNGNTNTYALNVINGSSTSLGGITSTGVLTSGTFNFGGTWNPAGSGSRVGFDSGSRGVVIAQGVSLLLQPYATNYTNQPVVVGNNLSRSEKFQVDGTSYVSGNATFAGEIIGKDCFNSGGTFAIRANNFVFGSDSVAAGSFQYRTTTGNSFSFGYIVANSSVATYQVVSNGRMEWDSSATATPYLFRAGGSEIARFANGNLLIGTTTDAGYKLDVNGTARVSSNLTVNTYIFQEQGGVVINKNLTGLVTRLGTNNVVIGNGAGQKAGNNDINGQGVSRSVIIGDAAGQSDNNGSNQSNLVIIGYRAMPSINALTADHNIVAIGTNVNFNSGGTVVNLGNSQNFVAIGANSVMARNSIKNTLIGASARIYNTGGAGQEASNSTGYSYCTVIGAEAIGEANNAIILGRTSDDVLMGYTQKVGGTFKLQVGGNIYSSGTLALGTTSPNASALLDITSTTKGFLPPRMTNAQMVAIGTPASGLMVYDTTNNKLNVYDGTNWVAVH